MNKTFILLLSIIISCNARFHSFKNQHKKEESSSNNLEALTRSIWKHHIDAWDAKDVRIRRVFEQLYPLFAQGNNHIDDATILGETVYISWHFKPSIYPLYTHHGTDSFFIVNGKIRSQTIFSTLYDFMNIE